MIINAEIITIGDEILIGQTVDSNSALIGEVLSGLGFEVRQITSISDSAEEIKRSLDESLKRSELLIVTGGLGPTNDDITKTTLNDYFGGNLVEDPTVLDGIKRLLRNRKVPLNKLNIAQALVPDNCTVIPNALGTAPGMLFEKEGRVVISLPGVPYEMKGLMQEKVPEIIKERFPRPDIIHRMVMTTGYPESYLAALIAGWEDTLPDFINLAYLPSPGIVKLRLTSKGKSRQQMESTLNEEIEQLCEIIPNAVFSLENISLEEEIGRILSRKGMTIASAESCTGGKIASLLTAIPGSSEYFKGSIVAYDYNIKRDFLEVPQQVLNKHGAVSREVVKTMALNIRLKFDTDIAIAVSGIAGPDGGTDEKPVGTVWIAVADRTQIIAKKFLFGNLRELNITRSSMAALNMVWQQIREVGTK